jgi:hypothetical protein
VVQGIGPVFKLKGQAWWFIPVIPALQRLEQEDHQFQTRLNCIVKLFLNFYLFAV